MQILPESSQVKEHKFHKIRRRSHPRDCDAGATVKSDRRVNELLHKGAVTTKRRLQDFPGGDGRRVTPVPISNTEVKPSSADGTALETGWESRTLPGVILSPS